MRFETKIIALGAACFLLFTIANFPARAAFRLFAPDSVSAFGVSGTLWNGSAKIINAGGQQLRNTEWDLALSQLLVARLGADLKTRWNGGFLEGFGAISAFGTVVLSESDASLNLGALGSMLKGPPIDGQVSVRIEQLELQDRWPVELIASAELRNLSSSMMGEGSAARMGDFGLSFDTTSEEDTEAITGKISDTGGPLEVSGTLLLTRPANYTLRVSVKARPEAPDMLRKNLEFLGSPEPDGTRIFQLAGSI
jgi:hypothetical protein